MTKRYTEHEFVLAVRNSVSWAGVFRELGLRPSGGNYQLSQDRAKRLQLSIDHFTGQAHLKNKTHGWSKRRSLDDILVKNSSYSGSDNLKKRLIKAGLLEEKCHECNLTEWRVCPIVLELDHKNGNNRDHRIKNLRLLCCNCHALTPTWRGRKNNKRAPVAQRQRHMV